MQYSIVTIQFIAIFHYNNTIYCNTILQCFKPPCRSHHSMHFTSILHIVLTLRPFLSGTLFRAYWSIFEYRMAGSRILAVAMFTFSTSWLLFSLVSALSVTMNGYFCFFPAVSCLPAAWKVGGVVVRVVWNILKFIYHSPTAQYKIDVVWHVYIWD